MSAPLSLDRLRRLQATLTRRIGGRDPQRIVSIGFAPTEAANYVADLRRPNSGDGWLPLTAQVDVTPRGTAGGAESIEPVAAVRLFNRQQRTYDRWRIKTMLRPAASIVATGVRVSLHAQQATTSVVARWTTVPLDSSSWASPALDDLRWRWGVLTVSHLFAAAARTAGKRRPQVGRNVWCGQGPDVVEGRLVARGRIPGGPDLGLIETGWDRLSLSGFFPNALPTDIHFAQEKELLRWTAQGTDGTFIATDRPSRWRWTTFYPQLTLPGLGRLQSIIRYQVIDQPNGQAARGPFGPGTSGGVLVTGGIPIGIQIAASQPDFRVGYAQTFQNSLRWLQRKLGATQLSIAAVVTSADRH